MPNGRNAGRLFADCENTHGYGVSHQVPDGSQEGDEVFCTNCHRPFRIQDGGVKPLEWERYDELVDSMSEEELKEREKEQVAQGDE